MPIANRASQIQGLFAKNLSVNHGLADMSTTRQKEQLNKDHYSSSSSSLASLKIVQIECASCRERCLFHSDFKSVLASFNEEAPKTGQLFLRRSILSRYRDSLAGLRNHDPCPRIYSPAFQGATCESRFFTAIAGPMETPKICNLSAAHG
jgi:hypothetical protein